MGSWWLPGLVGQGPHDLNSCANSENMESLLRGLGSVTPSPSMGATLQTCILSPDLLGSLRVSHWPPVSDPPLDASRLPLFGCLGWCSTYMKLLSCALGSAKMPHAKCGL
jgi:hypothetical protein